MGETFKSWMARLEEMDKKATPLPWRWFGNTKAKSVYLATPKQGRRFVMNFTRWGMQGAQPRFNVKMVMRDTSELVETDHNDAILKINHPDAQFIEDSRTDLPRLMRCLKRAVSVIVRLKEKMQAEKDVSDYFAERYGEALSESNRLKAELAAVNQELLTLREPEQAAILKRMEIGDNAFSAEIEGGMVRTIMANFVELFKIQKAANYIGWEAESSGERYTLTFQRLHGENPANKAARLQAENDRLQADLAAVNRKWAECEAKADHYERLINCDATQRWDELTDAERESKIQYWLKAHEEEKE